MRLYGDPCSTRMCVGVGGGVSYVQAVTIHNIFTWCCGMLGCYSRRLADISHKCDHCKRLIIHTLGVSTKGKITPLKRQIIVASVWTADNGHCSSFCILNLNVKVTSDQIANILSSNLLNIDYSHSCTPNLVIAWYHAQFIRDKSCSRWLVPPLIMYMRWTWLVLKALHLCNHRTFYIPSLYLRA